VVNVHALLAVRINGDGHREILGLQVSSADPKGSAEMVAAAIRKIFAQPRADPRPARHGDPSDHPQAGAADRVCKAQVRALPAAGLPWQSSILTRPHERHHGSAYVVRAEASEGEAGATVPRLNLRDGALPM
jgi:hypothetical protein